MMEVYIVHEGTGTIINFAECTMAIVFPDNELAEEALLDDNADRLLETANLTAPMNDADSLRAVLGVVER